MKKKFSRTGARKKMDDFFRKEEELDPKYVKKMKRLAMSHNIKLGEHRKRFCTKCFADLKYHTKSTRVSRTHKTVECGECGEKKRWKFNGGLVD